MSLRNTPQPTADVDAPTSRRETGVNIAGSADAVLNSVNGFATIAARIEAAVQQIEQAKNAAIQEIMNKVNSIAIPLHLQPNQQADAIAGGDGRGTDQANQGIMVRVE